MVSPQPADYGSCEPTSDASIHMVRTFDYLHAALMKIRERPQRIMHSGEGNPAAIEFLTAIREQGRAGEVGRELENVVTLGCPILVDVRGGCHEHRNREFAREQLFGRARFD